MVAYRVRKHLEIDMATIHPGTDYLGLVASVPIEDRQKMFKSEFESDIMVCLASLAGERIFFAGDSASGVSGDLEQATEIAILMEGFWGMGSTIASHAIIQRAQIHGGGPTQKPGDLNKELLSGSMGQRVEDNLNRLLRRTHTLIERERDTILRVAHALEEQKTLAGEDVVAVIEKEMGTVVDGSIYHDPEFVGEIERYHERMLLAHQEGTQRVEFEPPQRHALRTARGAGGGRTGAGTVTPRSLRAERAENGSVPPVFIDHRGEAIVGPGTSKLLTAKRDGDDDEEPEDTDRSALAPGGPLQEALHLHHVEPPAELPADLALGARRARSRTPSAARSTRRCRRRCARSPSGSRGARASSSSLSRISRPTPATLVLGEQVHRVLDGGGVGRARPERRQRPESHHVVGGVFAATTATTAGWAPECSSIQSTCSSRVRGTMSNSAVDSVT